jgi:hypothetical protein
MRSLITSASSALTFAVTCVLCFAAACGSRTGLVEAQFDGGAARPAQVRCPPTTGALCAAGEVCCAASGCPVRYACTAASTCPVTDYRFPSGLACDDAADCGGLACCAVPYNHNLASGACIAWSTACRASCAIGTDATGVAPAGRLCHANVDCADLAQSCCDCDASGPAVCVARCDTPRCRVVE